MTTIKPLFLLLPLLLVACFVPVSDAQIRLDPTPRVDSSSKAPSPPKSIAPLFDTGAVQEQVVSPDEAFKINVTGVAPDALVVRLDIADCCYLYRDKTRFELTGAGAARLGRYTLPPGATKTDEFFGATEVYHRNVDVRLPIYGMSGTAIPALHVTYQGCSEKGVAICYPPITKTFELRRVNNVLSAAPVQVEASLVDTAAPSTGIGKMIVSMFAAFGVGLLLTFTPCVLPMIPILSSVIVSSSDRHLTKLEGGLLSLAYVLGTAVTYSAAGAIAGATGEQLQAYFQHPAVLVAFSVLFVSLALSMFGFYQLQIPAFIQSHLHHHSHRIHVRTKHIKGGAYFGVFAMGLMSALIIGACVSPLFISVLGVAIANHDPVLGGALMFALALGMGVILIAVGVGAGVVLPKAGAWMGQVKNAFGAMLLAVAIYLLGFIPAVPVLLLWAALFIVTAVFLGATQRLPKDASGWRYLWKGLGTLLLVWGVLALIGGLAGNRDVLNPLPATLFSAQTRAAAESNTPLLQAVKTLPDLEDRLAEASNAGKPAILDYYATWCADCVRMENSTFLDTRVREAIASRFVALQVDVTDPNHPESKALKRRFEVYGPPAMLFFSASGQERRDLRTYGYKSPEAFLALLAEL